MPYPQLEPQRRDDEAALRPGANKTEIERRPGPRRPRSRKRWSAGAGRILAEVVERIVAARGATAPRHVDLWGPTTVKNGAGAGLDPIDWRNGWLTHLATNGAGIQSMNWEFGLPRQIGRGRSGERPGRPVRATGKKRDFYIKPGPETSGSVRGQRGTEEAVGAMIEDGWLGIFPDPKALEGRKSSSGSRPSRRVRPRRADLLGIFRAFSFPPAAWPFPTPWSRFSVQAAAVPARDSADGPSHVRSRYSYTIIP